MARAKKAKDGDDDDDDEYAAADDDDDYADDDWADVNATMRTMTTIAT